MRVNVAARPTIHTHEGAPAHRINAEQELRRTISACLLWENTFYEEGVDVAARIADLVPKCKPDFVANLAIEARGPLKLRHAPLLLVVEMTKHAAHRKLVRRTLVQVIQRADELAEFLALYWKDGRHPICAQVNRGLADAFTKFNAYSLAKYNRAGAVKLRDVLFMCRAKPKDAEQAATWKKLIDGTLESPDTWEVALSSGADKKATWERLLAEKKLGALALLRNLRNMQQAGVDIGVIGAAIRECDTERVLPYRFIAAARHAPQLEPDLDSAFMRCVSQSPKIAGKTILIVDVSGSMYGSMVSAKSEMTRADAACALAAICREMCDDPRIYATAGNDGTRIHKTQQVPPRRGMALASAIHGMCHPLGGGGIFTKQVIDCVKGIEKSADRIIVITDEQDCGTHRGDSPLSVVPFGTHNYMINVSTYKNGVGYGQWTHIDGFSESVLQFVRDVESL